MMGEWKEVHPSIKPSARFSSASVTRTILRKGRKGEEDDEQQQQELYAFGGQDASQAFLSELWRYDAGSINQWTEIKTKGGGLLRQQHPSARGAATLSLIGQSHLVVSVQRCVVHTCLLIS